jgi:hypothetical protein
MTYFKFSPGSAASISLNAATAPSAGVAIAFNDCRQVNWLIQGSGAIDGGTVIVESAHSQDYSGTWNLLDSVEAATLNGGALYGNTFPMPPGGFVRIRIDTEITGGGNIVGRLNGLIG